MKGKRLLLGDEALALGALHAGLSGVYAYPGTPSTEITEYIQGDALARERGVRSRWCTNEKTAMEAALGMSYAGKRALVCMKHVGMNVCADAFVNAGVTGVKGGLVVVAADDPSMHSSQNEQDSRFYGKFALVPVLEPSDQQECYVQHAACLLGVHQIIIDIARMKNSLLDSGLGDLMEDDTLCVFLIQTQYLFQMPCDRFSLAVLIGSQPYGVGFLHFLLELLDEMFFMCINGIMRLVAVLEIDTHGVLAQRFDIADMPLTAQHMIVLTQKFLNRFGFRRRLYYYQIFAHKCI